jgi:hypothetical protein
MSDTTKRQLDAGTAADPSKPAAPPIGPHELQYRIPCRGRSSGQVLDDVARALAESEAKSRDPLLVLEDLGLLEDSITSLINGLSRLVLGYPRTVSCWEASGYTEAFLSVIDAAQNSAPSRPPQAPGI